MIRDLSVVLRKKKFIFSKKYKYLLKFKKLENNKVMKIKNLVKK